MKVRQMGRVLAQDDILTTEPLTAYKIQESETDSWFGGQPVACQIQREEEQSQIIGN